MSAPASAAVRALAAELAGTVVARTDPSYESVRRGAVWNQLPVARHPELIVRVATEADIACALAFAREQGLRVALRAGGHSWCGTPLRDGSLLLDLGSLDVVSVDGATRTATVQPGVTNRGLALILAGHALAFPFGHCGSVALGGYVLAGGIGWNSRAWGLACHNLRAVDLVLPDGRCLTASADQHAEILWAARGAGPGFFAIVTRYHLGLHPLPAAIGSRHSVYPIATAPAVAVWIESIAPALPREVELTMFLASAPDRPGRACIVTATAFAGTPAAAARALRFMASCPVPARVDGALVASSTFDALFDGVAARFAPGHRATANTDWLARPLAEVTGVLCERLAAAPSPNTFFLCAIAPAPSTPIDAAFAPAGDVLVNTHAMWSDAASDAAHVEWHAATMAALAPFSAGHYVGEADVAAVAVHPARCFPPATWQRLASLRERYDPAHLLHGWFD